MTRAAGEQNNLTESMPDKTQQLHALMQSWRDSLNAPVRVDGDGEWQDWLEDDTDSQEVVVAEAQELEKRRELLQEAMHVLNERERNILTERRLKEDSTTLEDLSKVYGISRERVRQIEVRAFEKLQKAMRNAAAEANLESPA